MQESAKDWWTLHVVRADEVSFVTWEEFKKAFRNKFYPRSFCDAKRDKFMNFVQGNLIVAKYEKRFTELTKYALAFVIDETGKCKNFEHKLKAKIMTSVTANMDWLDFAKLFEATM